MQPTGGPTGGPTARGTTSPTSMVSADLCPWRTPCLSILHPLPSCSRGHDGGRGAHGVRRSGRRAAVHAVCGEEGGSTRGGGVMVRWAYSTIYPHAILTLIPPTHTAIPPLHKRSTHTYHAPPPIHPFFRYIFTHCIPCPPRCTMCVRAANRMRLAPRPPPATNTWCWWTGWVTSTPWPCR